MSGENIGMDDVPADPEPLPERGNVLVLFIYAACVVGSLYWLAAA